MPCRVTTPQCTTEASGVELGGRRLTRFNRSASGAFFTELPAPKVQFPPQSLRPLARCHDAFRENALLVV